MIMQKTKTTPKTQRLNAEIRQIRQSIHKFTYFITISLLLIFSLSLIQQCSASDSVTDMGDNINNDGDDDGSSSLPTCTIGMRLGTNENCMFTAFGTSYTFMVDANNNACVSEMCSNGIVILILPFGTNEFRATLFNPPMWEVERLPPETQPSLRPDAGTRSGCATLTPIMATSCLGSHMISGSVTEFHNDDSEMNRWLVQFGFNLTTDSNRIPSGKTLYMVLKGVVFRPVGGNNDGFLRTNSISYPGFNLYQIIGSSPSFSEHTSCNSNVEFAWFLSTPHNVQSVQDLTFQTWRGADFCASTVHATISGSP